MHKLTLTFLLLRFSWRRLYCLQVERGQAANTANFGGSMEITVDHTDISRWVLVFLADAPPARFARIYIWDTQRRHLWTSEQGDSRISNSSCRRYLFFELHGNLLSKVSSALCPLNSIPHAQHSRPKTNADQEMEERETEAWWRRVCARSDIKR